MSCSNQVCCKCTCTCHACVSWTRTGSSRCLACFRLGDIGEDSRGATATTTVACCWTSRWHLAGSEAFAFALAVATNLPKFPREFPGRYHTAVWIQICNTLQLGSWRWKSAVNFTIGCSASRVPYCTELYQVFGHFFHVLVTQTVQTVAAYNRMYNPVVCIVVYTSSSSLAV